MTDIRQTNIKDKKILHSSLECNIEKMIYQISDIFYFHVKNKHLHLTINIDPGIPKTLICDDHQLKHIITNLLGSVVIYTHLGGTISLDVCYLGENVLVWLVKPSKFEC